MYTPCEKYVVPLQYRLKTADQNLISVEHIYDYLFFASIMLTWAHHVEHTLARYSRTKMSNFCFCSAFRSNFRISCTILICDFKRLCNDLTTSNAKLKYQTTQASTKPKLILSMQKDYSKLPCIAGRMNTKRCKNVY